MRDMNESKKVCALDVYPVSSIEEIEKIAKETGGTVRRIVFCGSSNGDTPDGGEVHFIMSDEKKLGDED